MDTLVMPQLDMLERMKSTMRYRPAKGMDAMVRSVTSSGTVLS